MNIINTTENKTLEEKVSSESWIDKVGKYIDMKVETNKNYSSFVEGILTGMDFVGTIRGHMTQKPYFAGYVYDKYGIEHEQIQFIPGYQAPVKKRTIVEQFYKALGDIIGFTFNAASLIPQFTCMSLNLDNKNTQKQLKENKQLFDYFCKEYKVKTNYII